MLNIGKISNNISVRQGKSTAGATAKDLARNNSSAQKLIRPSVENLRAYIPSFSANNGVKSIPSDKEQLKAVKSLLDKKTAKKLDSLQNKGILLNNDSNDGSTVLYNLYRMATEPRIIGLSAPQLISEVITSLDNPSSITQKFGDIPDEVSAQIEQETGAKFPDKAKNVASSCCVVASMEFNLASRNPAEFARFAQGLTGADYSVTKKIKISDVSDGYVSSLWMLREFNTDYAIYPNWDDVTVKVEPDRNAIVRARVQTSYRDPGERSSVDVLIQSALLNLGSQHSYDAITDERTGKFNSDSTGLTEFEKNFVEEVVFGKPKVSVVYQQLDENGVVVGYNCKPEETKQHILKSLELGQNVIIGYTHMDENKKVNGGHEITIIGYETDANGKGVFICNDTDDNLSEPIKLEEDKLLPLIHHAGISKEALNPDDVIVEPWREILENYKKSLSSDNNLINQS